MPAVYLIIYLTNTVAVNRDSPFIIPHFALPCQAFLHYFFKFFSTFFLFAKKSPEMHDFRAFLRLFNIFRVYATLTHLIYHYASVRISISSSGKRHSRFLQKICQLFFVLFKHDSERCVYAIAPLNRTVIKHQIEVRSFYSAAYIFFGSKN